MLENLYDGKLVSVMESWCQWWKVDVNDENINCGHGKNSSRPSRQTQ